LEALATAEHQRAEELCFKLDDTEAALVRLRFDCSAQNKSTDEWQALWRRAEERVGELEAQNAALRKQYRSEVVLKSGVVRQQLPLEEIKAMQSASELKLPFGGDPFQDDMSCAGGMSVTSRSTDLSSKGANGRPSMSSVGSEPSVFEDSCAKDTESSFHGMPMQGRLRIARSLAKQVLT